MAKSYQQAGNPTVQPSVPYQQAGNPTVMPNQGSSLHNTASPQTVSPPAQGNQGIAQAFQGTAQFRPAPQQQTIINPNIPGQPFMGANSQLANLSANTAAKTGNQGIQVQGTAQPINQSPQPAQGVNQQVSPMAQPPQQLQQPQQPQTLNQIAPQAILQQPQITAPVQQPQIQVTPQIQQPITQQQVQPQQLPQQSGGLSSNFSPPPDQQTPPQQPQQVQAFNSATGQMEMTTTDDPRFNSGVLTQAAANYQTGQTSPQQNLVNALGTNSQQDFASHYQQALQNPQMTGADMLRQNLQQQLGTIDDPNVGMYLDKMASRASQSYQIGMGYITASSQELTDAINGTLTSPQTLVGVQAKQAQAMKDLNLQTLQAQKYWQTAQQAATTDQLQTKRADLEGFLKAQLALSNGSDTGSSTAALTVMSQSLHEADINMTLQNASYTFAQNQLSIQGSKVMQDYTNNIMQLGAQANQQRMQVTQDYYSQLADIDKQALTDEQTKRQLTSQAFGTYGQQMSDLYNQQQNRGLEYAKFGWQQIQDNKQYAYQLSGLTGNVYQPGPDGKPQLVTDANGQPVKTMQAFQNQFTNSLNTAQFQLSATAQNFAIASKAMDVASSQGYLYGDAGWNSTIQSISQSLGIPAQSLSQYTNINDLRAGVEQMSGNAQIIQGHIANGTSLNDIPQSFKNIFNVGGKGGQCGDFASTISTAPRVGPTYAARMQQVQQAGNIQDNPQPGYKMVTPLGLNTDGQGVGHIETVLSFDPNTRNMLTVDSNRDLNGTVAMHVENLDQISSQYQKQGWGFLPGQLQPGVQQKINALGQTSISAQTPPTPNWDTIHNSINNPNASTNPSASLYENKARQLAQGDIKESDLSNLPQGVQLRIQREATQMNLMYSASASDFKTDWLSPSGTNGAAINSFNTAIKHLGVLANVYQKMNNQGITKVNEMNNWLKQNASDPAVSEYNGIVNGVADEVAKASTGGAPSVADKAEAASAFDMNLGPRGLLQSIKGQMDLMGGKTNTLINSYNKKMGEYPIETFDPEALQAFKNLGMNPAQFDPSLKGTQDDTGVNPPTGRLIPTSQFFVSGTGGQQNSFALSTSQPSHKDSLQLGVGGDSLGILQ